MNRTLLYALGITGVFFVLGFLLLSENVIQAQSGSRPSQQYRVQPDAGSRVRQESETMQRPVDQPFEIRFWNWMAQAQYRNWASLPGAPSNAFAGSEPHGAMVKLFVNRLAASNPQQFPNGSVLIKENYAPDGEALKAITVMYRTQGFNPQAGDWYWIKYEPDGQVSRMNGMPISGKVGMCIDCHTDAGGNDFSFLNDK